jgi:hypothetical protein
MTPTPKSEPVRTATLLAPAIVWLAAYFWPGTEVSSEQATIAATVVLAAGSWFARRRVRPVAKGWNDATLARGGAVPPLDDPPRPLE